MITVGIDLGTTGIKAVAVDRENRVRGAHYIEYELSVLSEERIEQDADLWWELTRRAVREALRVGNIPPSEVRALAVSSQGLAFVPTDEAFRPLRPAFSWMDSRAKEETREILSKFSFEEIFARTGKRVNELYVLPKLLWLRRHEPEVWSATRKILTAHDFLLARMTGRAVTDRTMASGTLLFDVISCRWCDEILAAFDISPALLPEVRISGSAVGTLTEESAAELGLGPGVTAAVGAQDQKAAAFFVEPDEETATVCLGTACALEFPTKRPVSDPEMRIPLFPFVRPDTWTLEPVISAAGAALKWFRNTFWPELSYGELDERAAESEPGAGGIRFYPHLCTASSPDWSSEIPGAFWGLTLHSRRRDAARAVLEGIAFQIKRNLRLCESLSRPVRRLVVFGSGSRSDLWCQIIADVTGRVVRAADSPDASGLGAAALARESLGFESSSAVSCGIRRTFEPDPERSALYERIYDAYRETEERLTRGTRRGVETN